MLTKGGSLMEIEVKDIFEKFLNDNPKLEICSDSILEAFNILKNCYKNGSKVLICGNGGSAADSEHIVGELMKGFIKKRALPYSDINNLRKAYPEEWQYLADNLQGALPAISLVSQSALSTAFANDVSPDMVYAQLVYGYHKNGDVLIGLSTSGNSKNVVNAIKVAKAFDMLVIGFTGETGGIMHNLCDVTITVPARETYKVQEYHLPIYHVLCAMIEAEFFSE